MRKALFIVGPTAVGKTDLAFYLSKKVPSVLISADSVQVFKGADIISGKDNSVATELIDLVSPTQEFSVSDFVKSVRPIVEKAFSQRKIPIIVGGTGFYVDALFGKIDTISIPPNKILRTKLEKLSVIELQEQLKKVNSKRFSGMNNSDVNNKRRLIRAIEVGPNISKTTPVINPEDVLIIGLKTTSDNLRDRIIDRVKKRLEGGAMIEAKRLFADYENISPQLKSANGYRELLDYLLGKTSFDEAKKRWITADSLHSKNQMTWFKKGKKIVWFDIEKRGFEQEIMKLISHEISL